MTPVLILSTIIFFITSLVGCLILTLSSKRLEEKNLKPAIIIHFVLGIIVLLFTFLNGNIEKTNLAFYCSGLLLSGIIIRKNYHSLLKIYFGLFLSLVLFFVYSPSLLAYFVTGNYNKVKSPQTIILKDNIYLAEQQSMLGLSNEFTTYKVYKKNGLYKKTLLRDIDFGGKIDSLQLINFTDDTLIIKGFLNKRDTTLFKKPGIFKKGDVRIIKNN
ncbi:MAG: hypothetical protein RL516_649 [Bacteroidota bacterium]|jgi:hypothetical protein